MSYHVPRRNRIIKEHPEIKELNKPSSKLAVGTVALVASFLGVALCAPAVYAYSGWLWFALAYVVGGTMSAALTLAMHELAHRHAFVSDTANRLLGHLCDFGFLFPASATFRKFHMDHHAYMGTDKDVDLPTEWEQHTFKGPAGKTLWLFLQPLFYAFRPLALKPLPLGRWEAASIISAVAGNAVLYYISGSLQPNLFIYASDYLGMSLHPCAAHFIAEHYAFPGNPFEAETHSYYGILNMLTWNVGYHTEHHDFPNVPFDQLPKLRKIAYEKDDTVSVLKSWVGCQLNFIFNPACALDLRVRYDGADIKKQRKTN